MPQLLPGVIVPTLAGAAAEFTGDDMIFQFLNGTEALLTGELIQKLQAGVGQLQVAIHHFKGSHGVIQTQLGGFVDILHAGNTLLQQVHGLCLHSFVQPVDDETGDFLFDTYGGLADGGGKGQSGLKGGITGFFAVAHSAASPQEIEALIPYGLRIGTHHTNATGDRPKYPECRGVCVDETVNYNDSIYAELICDSMGIHVDPYMLRLVRKIKGDDKVVLISDAYACDGPIPPGYDGVDDINFDWEGEIAGSKMTLDISCRNMMKHTGASIVDVFKFASYNPARAVGFYDRGEIRKGLRADLVIVDHWMKVNKVIFKGELQE